MPCSPAKLEANRLNALRSTGPRTEEGKETCRRNALKHGLTGAGVVLPREDEAAVEARFEAFERELGAEGELERSLARRAALMMVRMDRSAEHEAAMLSRRVRVAEEAYDEERKTFVDDLAAGLHATPATVVRRLRSMPEGVDWLIAAWEGVKLDVIGPARDAFHGRHWNRMENLMGRRHGDIPESEAERLCQAAWGNLARLAEGEGAGLAPEARMAWARQRLAAWIDEQVAELRAHRATLDGSRAALDRADAGRRALFDPSPQATLARKYESAAERGFYRALKELKEMRDLEAQARAIEAEAEAAAVGPFFPEDAVAEIPVPERIREQPIGANLPPEASAGASRRGGKKGAPRRAASGRRPAPKSGSVGSVFPGGAMGTIAPGAPAREVGDMYLLLASGPVSAAPTPPPAGR